MNIKGILIIVLLLWCGGLSNNVFAQAPPPADCDPLETDINSPNYCVPVPLDTNIIFLIIGGLALGYYKIALDTKAKKASARQV